MGDQKTRGRLVPRRWHGAAWLTALAATDVAYRVLMRQHVRRALGMETGSA